MEDQDKKLFEISDRLNELIDNISRKCARLFPDHYEDIARQLLVEGKDIVDDTEIVGWIQEMRQLETLSAESNPWFILLNPEQNRNF